MSVAAWTRRRGFVGLKCSDIERCAFMAYLSHSQVLERRALVEEGVGGEEEYGRWPDEHPGGRRCPGELNWSAPRRLFDVK
jgi:hypothetical protein